MDRVSPPHTRRAPAPRPVVPVPWVSYEPRLVWRAWSIVPDDRYVEPSPMLAGLFGFPWRTAELDAKCTMRDRARTGSPLVTQWVDRHHVVVPDAECTCGIYAADDELARTALDVAPRGQPLASGFVELSGRILEVPGTVRAQHARIVGPLTIWAGRPPLATVLARRAGLPRSPRRVFTERGRYRVGWVNGVNGIDFERWREAAARLLAARYGVDVVWIERSR